MPNTLRCVLRPVALLMALVGVVLGRTNLAVIAADRGTIDRSVAGAAQYLRQEFENTRGGKRTLVAYALYKAGSPATSAEVASTLKDLLGRFDEGKYQAGPPAEGLYEAGILAMLLAEIDPVKYRPQIQAIADYLIESRLPAHVWSYRPADQPGDTSVTQYGSLGLWAAARAGIDIPDEIWDGIMLWHFQTHLGEGGFAYSPGTTIGSGAGASTLNNTAAAVGSMSIAALHLFPDQMQKQQGFAERKHSKKQDPSGLKFGVLEKERLPDPNDGPNETTAGGASPAKRKGPYKVKSTYAAYQQHTRRSLDWLAANFQVHNKTGPAMYYYYTLERMGALTGADQLGPYDWFDLCADFLIQKQLSDGSWDLDFYDRGGKNYVGTSFGILFLTRSTAKLLNRHPQSRVGGGLLTGNRGLPDDLTTVTLDEGRVQSRKPSGPLDELLAELTKAGGDDLFEVQEKIVAKIQLGDRSDLVGQTEQLVTLLQHPDPQIRRTAMWALGRSDNLNLVRHAIQALLEDPDADVLVEAHNALCWFARRPNGFGLPDNPFDGLPPDASDDKKRAAVGQWRTRAIQAWGKWYLRVCPYEERDDPFFVGLQRRLNRRS